MPPRSEVNDRTNSGKRIRGLLRGDLAGIMPEHYIYTCAYMCACVFGVTDLREKSPQLELLERSRPLGAAFSAVCSGDPTVRAGSLTRSKRAIRITIKLRSRARARARTRLSH